MRSDFSLNSWDSSLFLRRRPLISMHTAVRHRASPEFIGSRNCVSMTFTVESFRRHRASSPQVSSSDGAAFAGHNTPKCEKLHCIFDVQNKRAENT